jgi:hypothetical protein
MLSSSSSIQTSAFFTTVGQMQTVPHFSSLRKARQRLRESNVTIRSGTASSVYPQSSSTVSGTESPFSPRSIGESLTPSRTIISRPWIPMNHTMTIRHSIMSCIVFVFSSTITNVYCPPTPSCPLPTSRLPWLHHTRRQQGLLLPPF